MKLFVMVVSLSLASICPARDCLVYFGTFTDQTSKGIYVSRLDEATGRLSDPTLAAEAPSPSFLAISPGGRFLYAAARPSPTNGPKTGAVDAFVIDPGSGKLTFLNQRSSGGDGPCHIRTDATGRTVLVANYAGGSVQSLPILTDGSLGDGGTFVQFHGSGVNTNRQTKPYGHCIIPDPSNRFALACDLGTDKVMIFKLNPTNATLTANDPHSASVPPGSGARHMAFSPDGKHAYVLNEMACTVTTFKWDAAKGRLKSRNTISALPKAVTVQTNFTAAEIAVRPDGRFVYATIRGHDSISVFAVNRFTGRLSLVDNIPSGGKIPRGMGIDPSGHWLLIANQRTSNIVTYSISVKTGLLTPTGQALTIGSPVDVEFVK